MYFSELRPGTSRLLPWHHNVIMVLMLSDTRTWIVTSNQRFAELAALPPPWIIWWAIFVSSLESTMWPLTASGTSLRRVRQLKLAGKGSSKHTTSRAFSMSSRFCLFLFSELMENVCEVHGRRKRIIIVQIHGNRISCAFNVLVLYLS